MNNEIKFESLKQLYERVLPALRSKVKELNKMGITYVNEEDIWNCLREKEWNNKGTLSLYDIVDDILNTDNKIIETYKLNKISELKTKANNEGDTII